MLTAKYNNSIINCFDEKYDKDTLKSLDGGGFLLCPICEKPYTYCHGEVKIPYFRHKNNSDCISKYMEGESEEHLKGKIALYNWIRKQDGVTNAVLEPYIKNTKQIPDIGFRYNGIPFVIEYQCSPINEDFQERRKLYKSIGITDIWILGTDKYLEKSEIGKDFRIKEIERHCEYYYDSAYNIFVFSKIQNKPCLYFDGYNDGYYFENNRKVLHTNMIWGRKERYSALNRNLTFVGLNFVDITKGGFSISDEARKNTINKYSVELDVLKSYIFYLCGEI